MPFQPPSGLNESSVLVPPPNAPNVNNLDTIPTSVPQLLHAAGALALTSLGHTPAQNPPVLQMVALALTLLLSVQTAPAPMNPTLKIVLCVFLLVLVKIWMLLLSISSFVLVSDSPPVVLFRYIDHYIVCFFGLVVWYAGFSRPYRFIFFGAGG